MIALPVGSLLALALPGDSAAGNVLYSLSGRLDLTTAVTQIATGTPLSLAAVGPPFSGASVLRADLVCSSVPPASPAMADRVMLVLDFQHAVTLGDLTGGPVVHADVTAAVKGSVGSAAEFHLLPVTGNLSACALFTVW